MTIVIPPPPVACLWLTAPKAQMWRLRCLAWLQLSIMSLNMKRLLCKIIHPSTLHTSPGFSFSVWCEISLIALTPCILYFPALAFSFIFTVSLACTLLNRCTWGCNDITSGLIMSEHREEVFSIMTEIHKQVFKFTFKGCTWTTESYRLCSEKWSCIIMQPSYFLQTQNIN